MARNISINWEPGGKFVTVVLMDVETVTAPVASTTIELCILDFLIRAKGIEVHSLGANFTAGYTGWTLQTKPSYDNKTFGAASTLDTSSTTGNRISAQFADRTKFGRFNAIELVLGAAGDAGTLSLMLVIELLT